ncbi:MAG: efflux RND transporter permease subunit [Bacteroidetes bacterium]|nr:efflux RND transporter permease subunit [Bacteroidota bacterium]
MEKNETKKVIREFGLTTWALNNKNTVYLLIVILLVFGLYSYRSLPKELFPDIVLPTIMVQTIYPGNPPIDIENLITRPLEKEIESIKGINELRSTSSQDISAIFVEFNTDVDVDQALQDVKDAVDKAKSELPNDLLDDPMVMDIDFSEFPIINVNLSGDFSLNELKKYAEYLEDEIERIYEISKVEIIGLNEREMQIKVDPYKLAAVELSFNDIENAIAAENISMSGGELLLGDNRRSIRIIGEFTSPNEISNIIVKNENNRIVYLKDVAEITFGFEETKSYTRLDRNPVVTLQVIKKGGENLLAATDQVFQVLADARSVRAIPEDLNISITQDQSDIVRKQLSNLENSMVMGVIFVILVLYYFLGTRNALFVGFAIPTSMFLSFMVLGFMQTRINMIVLFSLILALGMLVDNAIVVVENIYRFIDRGYSKMQAARQAVGEIAMPIISSTATTLAAFFPLLFWDSMVGEFMKYLPTTLIIVLTSSLFVALVIIPVISSTFIKRSEQESPMNKKRSLLFALVMLVISALLYLGKMNVGGALFLIFGIIGILNIFLFYPSSQWFQSVFLVKLENWYDRLLRFAIRKNNAFYFLAGIILLLIVTVGFYFGTNPRMTFFPDSDPSYINILAEGPIGMDIEASNEFMKDIENKVFNVLEPYKPIVKDVLVTVGSGARSEDEVFDMSEKLNRGLVTINFVDFDKRGNLNSNDALIDLSDALVGKYPGIQISIAKQSEGPPAGKAVNIEVSGRDFQKLLYLTDTLQSIIETAKIEGIEGLKIDLDVGKPEIQLSIDRDKARRFGLSTGQIASTIRTALFGKEISDYKIGEDEYPIQLRLQDNFRYDIPALLNQKITFRDQANGKIVQVPVSAVADISYSTTYGEVKRKDMERVVTIYSNVIEGYNATEINNQIKAILMDFPMPYGYQYKFTGEQEEMAESLAFLERALLIALSLILMILVTQFNSIVKPIIILASVLFSTIGVFGGLGTFRMDFIVIMTGIGIVSLAGVVVNNAIVLIDYIDLLKKRKRKELGLEDNAILSIKDSTACVIEAGRTRLRPVLLTAITTILGLLPLAMGLNIDIIGFLKSFDPNIYFGGDNAAYWGPISWTIIFGLSFATFLTLIIVPSMYHIVYLGKVKINRTLTKKRKP